MIKYLKIMQAINNRVKQVKDDTIRVEEIEEIRNIITDILLGEYENKLPDTKKPIENTVYVKQLKWGGLNEDVKYNGYSKVFYIESEKYGYVQSENLEDAINRFKILVRQKQIEILDENEENTSLA